MISGGSSQKGNKWHSIDASPLKAKLANRFCIFPKAEKKNLSNYTRGDTPVYLNVYDLTTANGYVYWAGLGIFHSAVEGKH
ncbi:hypothetical protein LINPERPRIM_LOCUS9050 [Linum perenne]